MTTRRPGIGALLFAWAGAALFAASLLIFLYLYGIGYRRAPATTGAAAIVIDVLLFTAFALHHSIFARSGLKRRVAKILPPFVERAVYTWVASLLFLGVCLLWRPVDGVVYAWPGAWAIVARGVQIAGLALTAIASAAIDVLDLAGVRPILGARGGAAPRHVALKTDGAYRWVRHPLYFGWTLFVFGAPEMTGTHLLFALVSTLYLAVAIPFEERSLVDVFGDAYRSYQRATPSRLLPGLW
jgi:protein-S-isoprenylcysteine O-methyltransferase Ste14